MGKHSVSGSDRAKHIRKIEYSRTPVESPAGIARYVGRVGALAVALGVGSALVSMPIAFADTTGSAGSSADSTDQSGATTKVTRGGRPGTRTPDMA